MSGSASATVKTVQYLDPRIEPQPDPVYDFVIGPTQNQYYQIPASGKSNSSLTFNNLTTLGIDRAYLDTFELELSVDIVFDVAANQAYNANTDENIIYPPPWAWTFDSFPFNKCCDEARVNINGGAFFSQPLSYIRAKERYMNQRRLAECYENVCPIYRAENQTETGRSYAEAADIDATISSSLNDFIANNDNSSNYNLGVSRYGYAIRPYTIGTAGICGGFNNDIIKLGKDLVKDSNNVVCGYERYYINPTNRRQTIVKVTWREPIFVSPFSSRYDATYGRPLYNITSMDFSFTMQNLGNMIRLVNIQDQIGGNYVTGYTINITSAKLCYQVMTIPPILTKPLTTLVPYRRFVPYITDYHQAVTTAANTEIPVSGAIDVELTSGVYTFNEIPTAIWVYVAPYKADLQQNEPDFFNALNPDSKDLPVPVADEATTLPSWDTNRVFASIKQINISMANTTQILATAKAIDLYRIAKANGCEDSYMSWHSCTFGNDRICNPTWGSTKNPGTSNNVWLTELRSGVGSVLRLKPGVDLIVPDQPLIPGANANNMVFQCSVKCDVPAHSVRHARYALWLLFEYVGVAAISPGQCEITMNPLGSGEIMAVSPVMSATSEATEGELEGSGFWDKVKRATGIAGQLADDGIISMLLKHIPGAEKAADWAKKHGLGEPAMKRGRGGACSGGAVIGKGLNDWI